MYSDPPRYVGQGVYWDERELRCKRKLTFWTLRLQDLLDIAARQRLVQTVSYHLHGRKKQNLSRSREER